MTKKTATAAEVRDCFIVEDIAETIAEAADTMGEMLDRRKSGELLSGCLESISKVVNGKLTNYDRLCLVARQAFLVGYMEAVEIQLEAAKMNYEALFSNV